MTRHLEECLLLYPKNFWFKPIDVYPQIRRARYVLDRLENFGKLKSKIDMSADYQTTKSYMVIDNQEGVQ